MTDSQKSIADTFQKTKTVPLLGTTKLLTSDGELITVEELSGQYNEAVRVAFSAPHGRVKFETMNNFRPSETTVAHVIKIYLSNGHVLSATEFDEYITAEGELISASTLSVDDAIRVLCYNPKTRFLSSLAARVDTVYRTSLPKGPQFLYDVDYRSGDSFPLIGGEIDNLEVSCVSYSSSI